MLLPGCQSGDICLHADLASEAAKYSEEAAAAALVLGLAVACFYVYRASKGQGISQQPDSPSLPQDDEANDQSPVGRVRQIVQRLKGHA